MVEYLEGRTKLDDAVACLKRDTKRYAKRQLTWFRHEEGLEWHRMEGPAFIERVLDSLVERIGGAWARSV
jgi:tRNA dimethylallyltransferase